MKVLIVEDDSAMARSIEVFLRGEGFECFSTDLGEEAVDLAHLYEYDAVVLDLQLPDISGFTVLEKIRKSKNPTSTVPIVVLSGTSTVESKVKALRLGADDYMTKPFDSRELVARIHAVVRRSRATAKSKI